jgi:NADH-quinone oxidoreductase subunit I
MKTLVDVVSEIGYSLASVGKGLGVTFVNLMRPKTTLQYPDQRQELPPRYRGLPVADIPKCIGCLLCERICPNQLIKIETSRREDKGKNIDRFDMDYALCMLCNLCEEVCPTEAIFLEGGYELVGTSRAQLKAGIVDGWVKPGLIDETKETVSA